MTDINNVVIAGRLVRDPEVRYSATGMAIASFSVASNHHYQDKTGQWKDEVAFVPCTLFGKPGEQMAHKHKGESILVTGRLRTDSWQKDGTPQSRLTLVAEAVRFIQPSAKTEDAKALGGAGQVSEEVKKAVPF